MFWIIGKSELAVLPGGLGWSWVLAAPRAGAWALQFPSVSPNTFLLFSLWGLLLTLLVLLFFLRVFSYTSPYSLTTWPLEGSDFETPTPPRPASVLDIPLPSSLAHRTYWRRGAWLWPVGPPDGTSHCRWRRGAWPGLQGDAQAPRPRWETEGEDKAWVGSEPSVMCTWWLSAAWPLRSWPYIFSCVQSSAVYKPLALAVLLDPHTFLKATLNWNFCWVEN